MRQLSKLDQLICGVDALVRSIFVPMHRGASRPSPAKDIKDMSLTHKERRHTAGLMRVNHAGEVCAQALYQGQALTASSSVIQQHMQQAAKEEIDHLAWCETRLHELESRPSLLNAFWYVGSWIMGALAGLAGDRWSLGFVVETEKQVGAHLATHIQRLHANDEKTRAILMVMQKDELEHANIAMAAGAAELPEIVKDLMRLVAKLMTKSSYYV